MGKKKRRGGRRKIKRIGAMGGMAGAGLLAYNAYTTSGPAGAVQVMTGFNPADGSFNIKNAHGLIAVVAGAAISMLGAKLGLNRYLPPGWGI